MAVIVELQDNNWDFSIKKESPRVTFSLPKDRKMPCDPYAQLKQLENQAPKMKGLWTDQ